MGKEMTTTQQILTLFESVKRSGDGWQALCPAHSDQQNSLSIKKGDDGRTLLKCFAGCKTEDVVAVLGLEMKDLFPKEMMSSLPPPESVAHRPRGETIN